MNLRCLSIIFETLVNIEKREYMKPAIIIPTYNERGNIEQLVARIFGLSIPDLFLIIVDDNSPDGTGAIADKLTVKHPEVFVLHRQKKEGLGKAYVAGFRKAFEMGADRILTMDADFSHDPNIIPALLRATQDVDLAIGSRYIAGGGTKNWNLARRLISRLGNFYARNVLGVSIRDMTTGFRCYRANVLQSLDLDHLASGGYVVLVELAYKTVQAGFRVQEVPILFTERKSGDSKFSLHIFIEAYKNIPKIRYQRQKVIFSARKPEKND